MVEENRQNDDQLFFKGQGDLEIGEHSLIRYNNEIVQRFIRYSGLDLRRNQELVLDFGAGIGTLADIWLRVTKIPPVCLEVDPIEKKHLTKRGFNVVSSLSELNCKFNFVYTSNVLEHIEDDCRTMRELSKIMEDGSRLAIYVPCFKILYSDLDLSLGHYRRYSMKELQQKLESSGFKIVHREYVDSIGFFASLLIKFFGWKSKTNIGGPKSLRFYDTFIFPTSRIIDKIGFKYFFGKNIFMVAEKI